MKKALSNLLAALAGGIVDLGSQRHPAGMALAVENRREAPTEAEYAQRPAAQGGRPTGAHDLRAAYRAGLIPSEE